MNKQCYHLFVSFETNYKHGYACRFLFPIYFAIWSPMLVFASVADTLDIPAPAQAREVLDGARRRKGWQPLKMEGAAP
jgi:hypothetical protein